MASKSGNKPLSDERRAEIRAQVVAYVREAKNYTQAATRLTEEKVPTLSGAKKPWPPITVRDIVVKDDARLAATLKRKPAKAKAEKPEVVAVVGDAEEPGAVEVVKATRHRRRRSSKPVPSGMPD